MRCGSTHVASNDDTLFVAATSTPAIAASHVAGSEAPQLALSVPVLHVSAGWKAHI